MWSNFCEAISRMSESQPGGVAKITIGQLVPWIVTAMSIATLIYTLGSVITGMRMEIDNDHATITTMQPVLYAIENQVAALNQRFTDEFGSQDTKAQRGNQ